MVKIILEWKPTASRRTERPRIILCFVDGAPLYNLVNIANLVHRFLSMFISFPYVFRATMYPSSGETTVSFIYKTKNKMAG